MRQDSDNGGLPAVLRIKNRAHFPLHISSLLVYVILKQVMHWSPKKQSPLMYNSIVFLKKNQVKWNEIIKKNNHIVLGQLREKGL